MDSQAVQVYFTFIIMFTKRVVCTLVYNFPQKQTCVQIVSFKILTKKFFGSNCGNYGNFRKIKIDLAIENTLGTFVVLELIKKSLDLQPFLSKFEFHS